MSFQWSSVADSAERHVWEVIVNCLEYLEKKSKILFIKVLNFIIGFNNEYAGDEVDKNSISGKLRLYNCAVHLSER